MPNFISEDDIEVAMVQRLQHLYGYDTLNCHTADPADLNDGSGRTDKRDVILHDRLKAAVTSLNPGLPESAIDDALKQLCAKWQAMSFIAPNRDMEQARRLILALPPTIPNPELAVDPDDGAISLEWYAGRSRVFSVSVGNSPRMACAGIDGTDSWHGVASFDGAKAPTFVLQSIQRVLA